MTTTSVKFLDSFSKTFKEQLLRDLEEKRKAIIKEMNEKMVVEVALIAAKYSAQVVTYEEALNAESAGRNVKIIFEAKLISEDDADD